MVSVGLKVVLIVCSDRAMQEALRMVVEEAGCRSLMAATVAVAQQHLERATPILILVDPACGAEACDALTAPCPIMEFPIRTSSTGVRRIARKGDAATKWLSQVVASHCEAKS
jgi:hypothetical protein